MSHRRRKIRRQAENPEPVAAPKAPAKKKPAARKKPAKKKAKK